MDSTKLALAAAVTTGLLSRAEHQPEPESLATNVAAYVDALTAAIDPPEAEPAAKKPSTEKKSV